MELDIETDLSLATANPNFTTDKLSFEAELTVGNYKVELDRLSYAPGAGINVELELKKNGKDLVTMKATQAGTITESFDKLNEGNIFIDLLGKVQVAGHTNNTSELIQTFLPSAAKAINEAEKNKASFWQRSYFDHVIRDETDYRIRWNYMDGNPARWAEDKYYSV
jgi:protein involved in polysaccharide export with SLBB domain